MVYPNTRKLQVNNGKATCSKCGILQDVGKFPWNKATRQKPYQYKTCNSCKSKYAISIRCKSIESYTRYLFDKVKNRSKNDGLKFNLTKKFILQQLVKQDYKCFYSGYSLTHAVGNIDTNLSFDRVDNSKGYIKGNVVLSCRRINRIKGDLTLYEMQLWIPDWFRKICEKDKR